MTHPLRLVVFIATAFFAFGWQSTSLADFVLDGIDGGIFRTKKDGTFVISYDHLGYGETVDTHAVSPDGRIVYGFLNNLGVSDILAFDVDTDELLEEHSIFLPGGVFGPPGIPFLHESTVTAPSQALIRANDPFGLGDLFVISTGGFGPFPPEQNIKRFNRTSRAYVETIEPPNSEGLLDFAFGLDGRVYLSAGANIYAYEEDPLSGFETSTSPLISLVHGNLGVGPGWKPLHQRLGYHREHRSIYSQWRLH